MRRRHVRDCDAADSEPVSSACRLSFCRGTEERPHSSENRFSVGRRITSAGGERPVLDLSFHLRREINAVSPVGVSIQTISYYGRQKTPPDHRTGARRVERLATKESSINSLPQRGVPPRGEPLQGQPLQGEPPRGSSPRRGPQRGEPPRGEPRRGTPLGGEPQGCEPPRG